MQKKYKKTVRYLIGNKEKSSLYRMHFVFKPNHINWKTYVPQLQLVNHLRSVEYLTDKGEMYQSLRLLNRVDPKSLNMSIYTPETYLISLRNPNWTDSELQFVENVKSGQWILKPSGGFGGSGIQLIENVTRVKRELKAYKKRAQTMDPKKISPKVDWVIQRYIVKPLLYDKKKFDYRFFVTVPCAEPFIAYHYEGFARKTIVDYKLIKKEVSLNDLAQQE